MVHSLSQSQTTVALVDDDPDLVRSVVCPMCHTDGSLTQGALAAGGAWRCTRCGQHWDADRLMAVAAYAVWVAERDRAEGAGPERSRTAAQHQDPPPEHVDGTS